MLAVPSATKPDSGHLPTLPPKEHKPLFVWLMPHDQEGQPTKVLTVQVKYTGLGLSKASTIHQQLEG